MKKPFFLFAMLLCISSIAQLNLDSLNQVWLDESQADTTRFKAMDDIIWEGYMYSNPDTASDLAEKLLAFAQLKKNRKWEAFALNAHGASFYQRGKLIDALDYYQQSLKIQEEIGDKKGMSASYNNIGYVFQVQGNMPEALKSFQRGLVIKNEISDVGGSAISLLGIATIYQETENYSQALNFYFDVLKIREEIGDKRGVAVVLNNIGTVYRAQGDLTKSLEYYKRSVAINEDLGNNEVLSNLLNNLGLVYADMGDYEEALKYYRRSLHLKEGSGMKVDIARTMNNIGNAYFMQGKIEKALDYALKCRAITQVEGSPVLIQINSNLLKDIYKAKKDGMMALEMYELEVQMRDSIMTAEIDKLFIQAEAKAEFEKEQLIKEQEEKETFRIAAEKVDRRNSIQYSGIGVGIFILFGLLFFMGKFQLPPWVLELSIFLPFLIFFEFLLVISDGTIEAWSGGEPAVKLLLNVVMAAAIFPLHSLLERVLKKRLFKAG